ncbi:MAG TPA: carboxypeptidase regulatory-like domain-containing protein, partial [Polyangiaceae bacterium LLY-WYZ-15_(1-7)]|nr:carboxypeptidase regulatory-like domain-containing protein [Polyangiaceae bacterium LLY-WYZ-15_(1-7)]
VVLDARDRPVVGAVVRWLAAEPGGNPAGALVPSPGRLSVTTGPVPPLPLDAITTGLGPAPTPALRPSGASTVTDGAGRFVLEGLPPGLGELHAEHAATAPARSDAMRLSAGEARTDLTLVAPEGGVVEGRVVDARGFPVGAVPLELRAEREPWPRGRLAEPDGTFRFEGVLGVAVLLARPAELPTVRERLEVGDGETVQVELVVETELSQLALRVFDDDGFPLEGASLTLSSLAARTPLRRVGLSGPDGTFVFSALPPPPWRLGVDHPEHAPVERVVATGEGEQRITLAEGGTVRGRVVDPWSEEPLAGVSVRLEGETLSRTLPTDAEGRFAAERLPRGRYLVALELPGRLPIEEEVTLEGEEVEVELRPEEGGELRGQVVDVLGDAVEGATVRAGRGEAEGRAAGEAESDAAGRFAMLLPPGLHAVLAEHPRAGRAEGPRVRVERGGSVSVRLVTDGRLPVDEEEEAAAEILTGVPVSVARRGGAVVVTAVHGAGAARVRVGDELLSVDDEPVLAASQARG